jgi:hypothetical protein
MQLSEDFEYLISYQDNWTLDLLIYQPKAVLHYLIVILLDLSYFMQN